MTKTYIDLKAQGTPDLYPSRKYKKKSKPKVYSTPKDMSSFVWEVQDSTTGAKSAFLQLKKKMQLEEVSKDVVDLLNSKAYSILTPQLQGSLDNAVETFKTSDIERVARRSIYCLLLEPTVYVFFWRKSK